MSQEPEHIMENLNEQDNLKENELLDVSKTAKRIVPIARLSPSA